MRKLSYRSLIAVGALGLVGGLLADLAMTLNNLSQVL